MKIICCIRPVPDPASRLVINESKTWIKDQDLSFVASESDNYALEEALRLKEKHGGEVVALSMGRESDAKLLRAALAMGADRAIHLVDQKFKGADEFATAEALAKAIEKDGGADAVLAGVQSDDLGSGATGVMIAGFLGWAHATIVIAVEASPESHKLTVKRELEAGLTETAEMSTPAVLTIQYGINQPRYASLKGIMAAKKKDFTVWTAADLGLETAGVGAAMVSVKEIHIPERTRKVEMISGTPEEAVTTLVEKLRKDAKVL
ncbi:MAG TPA: electron transfer flavoprotein subunit beta/FixA family protein [Terriglobia bacterium]|nr:electron transfer flavoprotein subunit beta/FixA family protein [Terriglobia bacterium]